MIIYIYVFNIYIYNLWNKKKTMMMLKKYIYMESILLIRIQLYGKKKCAYNIVMFCVMSFVRCSVLSSCSVCVFFFLYFQFIQCFSIFFFSWKKCFDIYILPPIPACYINIIRPAASSAGIFITFLAASRPSKICKKK